jgi:hypothetical protein
MLIKLAGPGERCDTGALPPLSGVWDRSDSSRSPWEEPRPRRRLVVVRLREAEQHEQQQHGRGGMARGSRDTFRRFTFGDGVLSSPLPCVERNTGSCRCSSTSADARLSPAVSSDIMSFFFLLFARLVYTACSFGWWLVVGAGLF